MGTPLPKVVKTKIPNKLITAVTLNTADQLPVSSSIYPARYTPTNPGIAPNAFIIPKTLPECFGAKS